MYLINGKTYTTIRAAMLEKARLIVEENRDEPIEVDDYNPDGDEMEMLRRTKCRQ
jgi:hypothetical protein